MSTLQAALPGSEISCAPATEAVIIEASLAHAVDQTDSGVIVTNAHGIIQYANAAAARMTGYSRAELLGQNPSLLKSGEQDPKFYKDLWATISSGGVWRGELINRRKDGSLYTESMTISGVRGPDGALMSYIAIKEDVTAQRASEEAQRLFASIVDSSMDAIVTATREGAVKTWNRAAENLFGYSAQEIAGKPVALLVAPDQLPLFHDVMSRTHGGKGSSQFETAGLTNTRQRVDLSISLTPTTDAAGNVVGHAAIIRDITAAKQTERRLRESEAKYRRLFETNLAGVIRTAMDGRILECNAAFARFLGFESEQELNGHSMLEYYSDPHDREDLLERLRSDGFISNAEIAFRGKNGNTVWSLINVALVYEQGCETVEGTIFDISRRKRYEQDLIEAGERAQESSRVKSEFLANMSHELRTPLNGIIGSLELLSQAELNPVTCEYLNIAKQSADSLLATIQEILDWTGLESGQTELEPRSFYIFTEIQTTLDGLARAATTKGLELKWRVDPRLPRMLVGDPLRLRQVLVNVVGNAIKFTERGSVTVSATQMSQTDDDIEIEFNVIDTGIGIPEHKKQSIFEPFGMADTSITRRFGGVGLGLPVSAGLIKMMGGAIRVDSKVSQGTHIRFTVKMGVPGARDGFLRRSAVPITIPTNWLAFQRHIDEGRASVVEIVSDTDRKLALTGQVWSASEGFVRAVAKTPLDSGVMVDVAFDENHRCKGEVVFCQQWPNEFNLGIQLAMPGRGRREPRFPVAMTAALTVLGDYGPREASIEVVDISGSGLGIVCGEALTAGCCVQIKSSVGIILGEIRYSERVDDGKFRCGVKMYHVIAASGTERPRRLWTWLRRKSHVGANGGGYAHARLANR